MALLRKIDTARKVGRSYTGFEKLVKADSTFPRPIKFGDTRQAPVYFDETEVDAWIESRKAAREKVAA